MRRTLEPEVMDTLEEALEYDAMDHRAPNEAFVERLVALGARGRMLDIGTGPGHVPLLVCERIRDAQVVAVDLAETMLERARAKVAAASPEVRGRIELRRADAKALPFPAGSFDVVFSNTILHHIPEPIDLLREARRVLRPGGCLLVRDLFRPPTPERVGELVRLHAAGANESQRELFRASLHAALTTPELEQLAREAGLEEVEVVVDSDRHHSLQRRAD